MEGTFCGWMDGDGEEEEEEEEEGDEGEVVHSAATCYCF